MNIIPVRKVTVTVFLFLFYCLASGKGYSADRNTIVPGKGVAGFSIGGYYSKNEKEINGIRLTVTNNRIVRIEINSSRYMLQGSWLRVSKNKKREVLRFYGEARILREGNQLRLNYPYDGISFTIEAKSDLISKISIFAPKAKVIQTKPKKTLDIYKDLYKRQKK
jgi:hypothetical protein